MLKILLCVYIALMPFLHALSPLPIIAANAMVLAVSTPFILIQRTPASFSFSRSNFLLLLIWLYGLAAWLWQPFDILQDRWQAALQWWFSLAFLWILVRRWIVTSKISFLTISTVSFFTTIFLGAASVFEFAYVNSTGLFISDFLYFSVDEFPYANIFGYSLLRPRVFSAEAGFSSMVFELIIPLSALHFLRTNAMLRLIFVGTAVLGLVSLFSVASILSGFISIVLLNIVKGKSRYLTIAILGIFVLLLAIYLIGIDFSNLPIYKIFEFFDESNYYLTEGSRQETLAAGGTLITQNPLGMGWGTVLQEAKIPGTEIDRMILGSGLISLWLELAVAVGVTLALLMAVHVVGVLVKLSRLKGVAADSSFVCLCSLSIHHLAVFEVWFPMFWFALALAQALTWEAKSQWPAQAKRLQLNTV